MDRNSEIERLVKEINALEEQEAGKLLELYRLVCKGLGYRAVNFSGFNWSNVWDQPERLIVPRLIDQKKRLIVEVFPGENPED